jgi:hypothetical protein
MTTKSNFGGMGDIDFNTVRTNKGTPAPQVAPVVVASTTPKKCAKCDETIINEEKCPKCFSLTEDAKPILLD